MGGQRTNWRRIAAAGALTITGALTIVGALVGSAPASGTAVAADQTAVPVTITAQLDGAGPVAGFGIVVAGQNGALVGLAGQVPSASADVTTAAAASTLLVTPPLTDGAPGGQVFVGQVLTPGTTLLDIVCTQADQPQDGSVHQVATSAPFQWEDPTRTIIGVSFLADAPTSCTIDDATTVISATKTADGASYSPGATVTYTLGAVNTGHVTLASGALADTLPAGLTISSVAPTEASTTCSTVGAVITCSLGSLPAGATRTVTVAATVDGATVDGASIQNTVNVSARAPAWSLIVPAPGQQLDAAAGPGEALAVLAAPMFPLSATASASVTVILPSTTAPTVTTAAPTASVAAEAPVSPTTTAATTVPAVALPKLPATGGGEASLTALATVLVGVGVGTLVGARRRPRAGPSTR